MVDKITQIFRLHEILFRLNELLFRLSESESLFRLSKLLSHISLRAP
jgi:hypothetical protein